MQVYSNAEILLIYSLKTENAFFLNDAVPYCFLGRK